MGLIPKVIHYIWLGGNAKPSLVNSCILSWREKLPDYKIIEWNESNLDLNKITQENRFFAECRKRNMWAFMADYLRLKILFEYGGIYLDTDMQVLKSFNPLLNDEIFLGQENMEKTVNCACMGSTKNNSYILKFLDYYDKQIWENAIFTIPDIITKVIGNEIKPTDIKIYPPEFFYPFPFQGDFSEDCITENTYTIHWWAGSWIGKLSPYLFLTTKHIHNQLWKFFVMIKKIGGYYNNKWFNRW